MKIGLSHEEATEKARAMLARGWVVGVSREGDAIGNPTDERVRELAALIESGAIGADASIPDAQAAMTRDRLKIDPLQVQRLASLDRRGREIGANLRSISDEFAALFRATCERVGVDPVKAAIDFDTGEIYERGN